MRPILPVCVLLAAAGLARGDVLARSATIAEVLRLLVEPSGEVVRVQGTVTFFDPARPGMYLQNGERGLFVHAPADAPLLHPGQRVEVRGRTRPGALEAIEIRAIGDGPLPDPVPVTGEAFAAGAAVHRRARLEGVVRSVERDGDRTVLCLMAGRTPVPVFVSNGSPDGSEPRHLVDARVRIDGVGERAGWSPKEVGGIHLLVAAPTAITVLRPAAPRPFELPLTPAAALPEFAEHRVRVAGTAAGPVTDGVLTLESDGRRIGIAVEPDVVVEGGERFEAVGFPDRRDGRPFLAHGRVRRFALRRGVTPAAADPEDYLPVVQSVSELRRMTLDETNRGYPVRLVATVTYRDAGLEELFIHDGTEGVYVFAPRDTVPLRSGTVVRVDGHSDPGEFAPAIRATQVTPLRAGRLPDPLRYGYYQLVGGQQDCQWVEFEAVVRGLAPGRVGEPNLMLRFGPTNCPVKVAGADPEALRRLFGATVRVRANCGSLFDDGRKWEGLLFYVPGTEAITVIRPAPARTADLPLRTVASLSRFDPARGFGEPVRLNGHVIARRGPVVVLQDATGGLVADLQPGQAGTVGDHLEVCGFLVRRGSQWAVEDALSRPTVAAGPPPFPRAVTPQEMAAGEHLAALVGMEAVVVDQFAAGDTDHVFLLRPAGPDGDDLFFTAVLPRDRLTADLADLRPGTRVRLTGTGTDSQPAAVVPAFRVLLRDAADVVVLERPSWWTLRRALTAVGLAALPVVLALTWVVTLRRRVRWQTEQIRRRLEREAHLEARYRELFESANDAVFTLDAVGTVRAMNRSGQSLTGLSEGGSFLDTVVPASRSAARQLVGCLTPDTREITLAGPAGDVVLEVSARPLLDGGSSAGVQAIARDLTDRRRLEAELRQAQKMEAIGRLAGGIAHDFNNLLTVINGNGEVLRAGLPPAEAGLADEIVRAGEQAATLTRQLLAFSRKGVVAPRVLCPNAAIANLRQMLDRLVGERVEVRTDLDAEAGCVRIDPGQLEQALLNLTVNARDAMPRGGTLTIRTRARPDAVRIEVTDTGVGMDAATRARAFEPFFTTKPVGEGTGLGLATVKGVVEQAGGMVSVESEPGRGTTFVIELPVAAGVRPHPSLPPAPPPPANREVILLVEDEPAVQLLEKRVLESARYEVLVASSGEEALNLLDRHRGRIDLLVTDVVMPGLTGRELAEAAARRQPGLRALFLSGYTPDEVLRQGVRAEEAHFLQKPFTPSSLLGKVRELLADP